MPSDDRAPPSGRQPGLTPEQAVDRLVQLHDSACSALRESLARFTKKGIVPGPEDRARFRYPELRLDWRPSGGSLPFTCDLPAGGVKSGRTCTWSYSAVNPTTTYTIGYGAGGSTCTTTATTMLNTSAARPV